VVNAILSVLSIPGSNGAPQLLLPHPRINLRRRDVPVAERPLDHVQVAGLPVEAAGEGVTKGVDGDAAGNAGLPAQGGEPELNLPRTQPLAPPAVKQGTPAPGDLS